MDAPEYKSGLWSPVAFEAGKMSAACGVSAQYRMFDHAFIDHRLPAPPTGDPPLTALYDSLTTNIPHPIMAFSSHSFPPSTPLFPKAAVVQQYLESYAKQFQLLPHIRFNHRVKNVERLISNWKVELSTGAVLEFDSIVVCNGHFHIPRYPDVPGVVLIVGGGPSGQDISAEMGTVADVVIHSTSEASPQDIRNIKQRGRVAKFGDNGQVTFEDGSSESNIDWCILATGYKFACDFLPESILRHFPLGPTHISLQSKYPPSSIVFMCLLIKTAPFPLVEAQMGAYLHVLADPETLDTTQEAVEVITRVFVDEEQFDYRDWLYEFAAKGDRSPVAHVHEWERRAFRNNQALRDFWVDLERKGEAEEWVRGVGEGGLHEWVDFMDRLIRLSKERNKGIDDEGDKSRL
ncbi:hypothetical protein BD779DRAFT_1680921 [Infundibulicybe gibba]|nr:hypothetical protein BD779DRAFT_1680921 [Infundibulicybe gibba]